jgi:transposase
VVNGIIWRTRTGAPWRDLPERFGPWQTCYKRFARWEADGTWAASSRPCNATPTRPTTWWRTRPTARGPTGQGCAPGGSRTPSPSGTTSGRTADAAGPVAARRGLTLRYASRNQVERGFNRRKQLRAVATRYDKLACRYQATLNVASILDWLRAKPDRDLGTRLRASG